MPWWLWPIAGCEEQWPGSGEKGWEHGRELRRSQEAGGARYQPGEALYSRTPPKRWQDRWSWPLGHSACKCYGIGKIESLLCIFFYGLFILARRQLTTYFIYLCYCVTYYSRGLVHSYVCLLLITSTTAAIPNSKCCFLRPSARCLAFLLSKWKSSVSPCLVSPTSLHLSRLRVCLVGLSTLFLLLKNLKANQRAIYPLGASKKNSFLAQSS